MQPILRHLADRMPRSEGMPFSFAKLILQAQTRAIQAQFVVKIASANAKCATIDPNGQWKALPNSQPCGSNVFTNTRQNRFQSGQTYQPGTPRATNDLRSKSTAPCAEPVSGGCRTANRRLETQVSRRSRRFRCVAIDRTTHRTHLNGFRSLSDWTIRRGPGSNGNGCLTDPGSEAKIYRRQPCRNLTENISSASRKPKWRNWQTR